MTDGRNTKLLFFKAACVYGAGQHWKFLKDNLTAQERFSWRQQYICTMSRVTRNLILMLFLAISTLTFQSADAQCSICTRTAQQMGDKPAKGLNAGILYLAATPLLVAGFIGYKWWK